MNMTKNQIDRTAEQLFKTRTDAVLYISTNGRVLNEIAFNSLSDKAKEAFAKRENPNPPKEKGESKPKNNTNEKAQ